MFRRDSHTIATPGGGDDLPPGGIKALPLRDWYGIGMGLGSGVDGDPVRTDHQLHQFPLDAMLIDHQPAPPAVDGIMI